jgi:hypothetical protein
MAGVFGKMRKTGADLSWTIDHTATAADLEKRKRFERLFSKKSSRFMLSNSEIDLFLMKQGTYRAFESYNDGTIVYRKFAHIGDNLPENRRIITPFVIHTRRMENINPTFSRFRLRVETKGSAKVKPHSTYYIVRNIAQIERILKRWKIIRSTPKPSRSRFLRDLDDSNDSDYHVPSPDSVERIEALWYREPAPPMSDSAGSSP